VWPGLCLELCKVLTLFVALRHIDYNGKVSGKTAYWCGMKSCCCNWSSEVTLSNQHQRCECDMSSRSKCLRSQAPLFYCYFALEDWSVASIVAPFSKSHTAGWTRGDSDCAWSSPAWWCRQDIGPLYDLPPGPRSKGLSIDLNNPVWGRIKSCIFGKYSKTCCWCLIKCS